LGKEEESSGGSDGGRWMDDNNGGGRRQLVPAGGRRNHTQHRAEERGEKVGHRRSWGFGDGPAAAATPRGDAGLRMVVGRR